MAVAAIAGLSILPARVRAAQSTVDGVVNVGEYDHSTVLADRIYTLSWTIAGDTAWSGIQAMTTGWVALGIDSADARVVPVIVQGRTMLPARFVAEQLGRAISYDPTTKVVTVTFPKP